MESLLIKNVESPAIDGAITVLTTAAFAWTPFSPIIPYDELPLKNSQLAQRMRVPKITSRGS